MDIEPKRKLMVRFDADHIRRYGGSGAGFHSEIEAAHAQGYPGLVSWGTLTLMPFWTLLARTPDDDFVGIKIDVRLSKPVFAGDEVSYAVLGSEEHSEGERLLLEAKTARSGVVASGSAIVPKRPS